MHAMDGIRRSEQNSMWNLSSPFTMWFIGMKLKVSVLEANAII